MSQIKKNKEPTSSIQDTIGKILCVSNGNAIGIIRIYHAKQIFE